MEDSRMLLAQLDIPSQVAPIIEDGPGADMTGFLEAIDKLEGAITYFERKRHLNTCEGQLRHARSLMKRAMQQFEDDFSDILGSSSLFVDPHDLRESFQSANKAGIYPTHELPELLERDAIEPLRKMATRMLHAPDSAARCATVYRDKRASELESTLRRLGVERLSDMESIPWTELAEKIKDWNINLQIAVRTLFSAEKNICSKIFAASPSLREKCFTEVAGPNMLWLLKFGEMVAVSSKKPEKLFSLLDMYQILDQLTTEVEAVFDGPSSLHVRRPTAALLKALRVAIRETFVEFEAQVEANGTEFTSQPETPNSPAEAPRRGLFSSFSRLARGMSMRDDSDADNPRTSLPRSLTANAGILSLTSYVVNYVRLFMSRELPYYDLLRAVFKDTSQGPGGGHAAAAAAGGGSFPSKLAGATHKLMLALQKNLTTKSRLYPNPAQAELFLMNNFNYMANNIASSPARELLGSAWMQRMRTMVHHHRDAYTSKAIIRMERAVEENTATVGARADPNLALNRLKNFREEIDDLYQRQSSWLVPDQEHAEVIRVALKRSVLELYRPLLAFCRDAIKTSHKFYVYEPEEVEQMMMEAFITRRSLSAKE